MHRSCPTKAEMQRIAAEGHGITSTFAGASDPQASAGTVSDPVVCVAYEQVKCVCVCVCV